MKMMMRICDSSVASIFFGVVSTAVIASIFYLVVNYKFYYTGAGWHIESEAIIVRNAIEAYVNSSGDKDYGVIRKCVANMISKDKSFVKVDCIKDNQIIWTEQNDKDKYLDGTREPVSYNDSINNNEHTYHISIKRGNRPKWYTQLYRAWTFSAADYFKNKDAYVKGRLDYRSWPLVLSVILSGILVTFAMLFFRRVNQDNIRQVSDLQNQLEDLVEQRNKLVMERDVMYESLNKLEYAGRQMQNEYTRLKDANEKSRALYEKYKNLIVKSADDDKKYTDLSMEYEEGNEYIKLIDEEIARLKNQLDDKNKEIELRKKHILEKEAVITKLQKNLSLMPHYAEDTSAQKKIERALKTVLPHVLFSKPALKQIVTDAPVSDVTTLEIMSQLLVALESNLDYEQLCKRYNCEVMKDTNGVYRLKKGDCRVYFFFITKNAKAINCYKNANVEVVEVLYKKKKDEISDYVKQCKPSWA